MHQSTLHYQRRKEEGNLFQCPECEYQTPYGTACIKQHIRHNHTYEKPFKCLECGKPYTQKNNLDKHCYKMHNTPMPSTRSTRTAIRTSLPYKFHAIWTLTTLIIHPKKRYEAIKGVYKAKPSTPLPYLASDAKAGYIDYGWRIQDMITKDQYIPTNTRSQKFSKAIANFMNQIHTLNQLHPDPSDITKQVVYMMKDYRKSIDLIKEAVVHYSKIKSP